jgi:hypothetical protein
LGQYAGLVSFSAVCCLLSAAASLQSAFCCLLSVVISISAPNATLLARCTALVSNQEPRCVLTFTLDRSNIAHHLIYVSLLTHLVGRERRAQGGQRATFERQSYCWSFRSYAWPRGRTQREATGDHHQIPKGLVGGGGCSCWGKKARWIGGRGGRGTG